MAKILYFINEDWFFVSHFLPMGRVAADAGLEVVIATRISDQAARIRAAGFRIIDVRADRRSLGLFKGLRDLVQAYGLIRRERPDIVHCIALRSVVVGGIAAKFAGTAAIVLAPTGLGHLWLENSLLIRVVRLFTRTLIGSWLRAPNVHYLFENADDPREFRLGVRDADVTIVGGSGIDPKKFPVTPEPPFHPVKIAVVARMIQPKGIEEAIAATRRARIQGADVELHLFGEPDPSNPISLTEEQLQRYSAEAGIYWHGATNDVPRVWREHHIALLLSHREGLPRTLVEAAAAGRPIVTTDVVGCREVVRDQKEGFLVPRGDIDATAQALIALASDAALRARMGAAAHARYLERFTEAAVTSTVGAVYRSYIPASSEALSFPSPVTSSSEGPGPSRAPRPKIAFICFDENFFLSHFLPVANAARANGFEVFALLPPDPSERIDSIPGINIIEIDVERARRQILRLAADVVAVASALRKCKPDMMQIFGLHPCVVSFLASLFISVPRQIFTITGLGLIDIDDRRLHRFVRPFVYWFLRAADWRGSACFVFENSADRKRLGFRTGRPKMSLTLMGAGVNPSAFTPSSMPPPLPLKLAIVSRMIWSKGVDLAVDAVTRMIDRGVPVELDLYGAPDFQNLRYFPLALLQEWGRRPGIRWHGYVKDIRGVWQAHHAALFPSRGGEGLPRAMLEAACCGRALIATDVPGCADFVRPGLEGILFKPNSVDELERAINTLVQQPQLWELMGQAARQRVLEHSTEEIIMSQYRGLFAQLLKSEFTT
jgi:glycosyltransferase involved in cell wall biosynthesis